MKAHGAVKHFKPVICPCGIKKMVCEKHRMSR